MRRAKSAVLLFAVSFILLVTVRGGAFIANVFYPPPPPLDETFAAEPLKLDAPLHDPDMYSQYQSLKFAGRLSGRESGLGAGSYPSPEGPVVLSSDDVIMLNRNYQLHRGEARTVEAPSEEGSDLSDWGSGTESDRLRAAPPD